MPSLQKELSFVEEQLGYSFKDTLLLELAFVHRSFVNENPMLAQGHNERLEFLGDAVLGLLVSDFLYLHLPNHPEGELSYLRSRLVEASACVFYLEKLQLKQFLLMGRGEGMNEGKGRSTILADLFEAIMGALYIDGGIEAVRKFFFGRFQSEVLAIIEKPHRNWKAELQDFCQKKCQKAPKYVVLEENGPDHLKTFLIGVTLEEQELGTGEGTSKKEGEQKAAEAAIKGLGL